MHQHDRVELIFYTVSDSICIDTSAVWVCSGVAGPRELAIGEIQLLWFLWRASAVRPPGDFFCVVDTLTLLLVIWMPNSNIC